MVYTKDRLLTVSTELRKKLANILIWRMELQDVETWTLGKEYVDNIESTRHVEIALNALRREDKVNNENLL